MIDNQKPIECFVMQTKDNTVKTTSTNQFVAQNNDDLDPIHNLMSRIPEPFMCLLYHQWTPNLNEQKENYNH